MKKFSKYLFRILLVVLIFGILASPILAIGDPEYTEIGDAFVFTGVLVPGDQLYFVRYDVSYDAMPEEEAKDTWQVALYQAGTNSLVATRPLNYYQHNIISIYLEPDEALEVSGAHRLRIMGMPSIFSSYEEGVNSKSRVLSPGDWYSGGLLGGYMLNQAAILEEDWDLTLLEGGKLNFTGAFFFLLGVPGLNSMDATIFSQTVRAREWEGWTSWYESYTEEVVNRTGPRLQNAIAGIMLMLGIESEAWAGAWFVGLASMLLAAPIFAFTKNPLWALVVSFPFMLGLAWLGLGTADLFRGLLIVVLVLGVIFSLTFWLRHMG